MKIKNLAIVAMMAMLAGAAVSCDKTPAEEPIVPSNVFFSAENGDYCFYVGSQDAKEVKVLVIREDTEKAAEYEIKVNSASEGVVIPETVAFKAGEAQAELVIEVPATAKTGDEYAFDLSLTGANVNKEAVSENGTLRCEGSIYLYQLLNFRARFGSSTSKPEFKVFGYFKQTGWKLNDKKVIVKDFLRSGHDLTITVGDGVDASSASYPEVTKYPVISLALSDYEMLVESVDGEGDYYWNCDKSENYTTYFPREDTQRNIYWMSMNVDKSTSYSFYYNRNKTDKASWLEYIRIYLGDFYIKTTADATDYTNYSGSYIYFSILSDEEYAAVDWSLPEM